MNLKKLIIHEIKKEQRTNETELVLSDDLIKVNQISIDLVTTLNQSYKKDKILYAIFDNGEGRYFPEKYTSYSESNRNNAAFVSFTRQVISNLNPILRQVTLATGGYFVFAEYSNIGNDFISVYLIRDVKGETFNRTRTSFTIETIEYVDTRNLAMACRINESKMGEIGNKYLSLTQFKQAEISDYFKDWISIEQLESNSEYTKHLYDIISQIERPTNPDNGIVYDIESFRNIIYDYIKSIPNKTINIHDLGQHFYGDSGIISNYAISNDITIDTEFRYNSAQLRRFVKLEVNRDGINLKFSRGIFNDKIRLSDQDRNIVIIESVSFANALRDEIDNT